MLWENDKEDTSPSFKSVRFSKLQMFDEIFCTNLNNRAQYGAAMLVFLRGTPTLQRENSVKIWNLLWLAILGY